MWAQIINTIIGIWLMAAPSVITYNNKGTINAAITGPLIATFAIISWWEVTEAVRKINIPLGIWLLLAPWALRYKETLPILNDMACGILVIIFSFVKRKIKKKYGGGWRALFHS